MKIPDNTICSNQLRWILFSLANLALVCFANAGLITGEHVVTNLNDAGDGSLRAALHASNESDGSDVIVFGEGASSGTIHLQSPLPAIFGVVTIDGPGADALSISGDSDDDGSPDVAILAIVGSFANATVSGLTLAEGVGHTHAPQHDDDEEDEEWQAGFGENDSSHYHRRRGGAVTVASGATLNLEKAAVIDCVARKHYQQPESAADLRNFDHAEDDDDDHDRHGFPAGAGIAVLLGNLHINSCLIANNRIGDDQTIVQQDEESVGDDRGEDEEDRTVGAGAAIFLIGSPSNEVTITNSTISGNDANSHSQGNAHSGAIYVAQLSGEDDMEWDGEEEDFEFHGGLDFGDDEEEDDKDESESEEDEERPRFTVVLTNNTVADNTTDRGCAGLVVKNHRPRLILKNNLFAQNVVEDDESTCNYRRRGGGPNQPAAVSMGGNIFDDASGNAFLTATNDLTENSSLVLGTLADNGGPTATHAIGEGSAAIGNAVEGAPENDQRCLARSDPADSGAYEFGAGGGPVNTPPVVVVEIEDISVNLGAAPMTFSVHPTFYDAEDSDLELDYAVTVNTDSGVVTTSAIAFSDGNLTLTFVGIGVSEIEITATDTGGLSASTRFKVSVGDNQKPVISGMPDNLSAPTDPGSATAVISWTTPTASDNVGVISFTSTHSPGDTFPLGSTTVTYTATDAAGNFCDASFTVSVSDTEKPEIASVPDNISVPTDAGSVTAVVSWTAPTASDNVGVASFVNTHNPGDTFPLGSTTVTYTATDAAGNVCDASFTVSVGDSEKPVISGAPNDIVTTTEPGLATAAVAWTPPTATDNVGVVSLTSSHPPGNVFSVGVTTVTYTATDTASNVCTDSFTVTVNDEEKPEIAGLPDDIVVQAEPGNTTAVVTWEEPTATDNVGVTSLTANLPSGSDFPIGETVVVYTAEDAAGNVCIAAFLVTVEEPEGGFFLDFISIRSDPAPGTDGSIFNTYQRAFINESDLVVFSGSVSGGGSAGNTGVWFGDVDSIAEVAVGGATAGTGVNYGIFTSVNISDTDEISFNSQLTGAVTSSSDVAHFAPAGASPLASQAREGGAAPGTPGNFNVISASVAGSNMNAFPGRLEIATPITARDDSGIWSTHTGTLELAAREGADADAIPGAKFGHITASMSMNESGEMAFIASLTSAGGGNVAVFSGLPGNFDVAFRRDGVAPGTGGATFRLFGAAAIGGSGDVAIFGSVNNSSALGVSSANNDGIWTNISGTTALVAREGDQVADLPTGVIFESFKESLVADDGSVCFSGFVKGPGVNSSNDGCLWSNASGSLVTLMREGGLAPGTDGSQIKSINGFSCNNNATVGIVADMITGIGDATSGSTQALWLSNPETAELDLALRTGTSFEIAPGDSRTIKIIKMDQSTNVRGAGGGSGRVLNDKD
ncbi:MAG: hypothetical protein ACI9UA_003468, partial [Pseudoalteromonas tetraodonis]